MPTEPTLPERFSDLAREIIVDGRIEADEVARVRETVYADGTVDREEAEFLFYLDAHGTGNAPEWATLYVDALSNFFLDGAAPKGVVGGHDAQFLIDRVNRDGKIDQRTEFELLVEIAARAIECPAEVLTLLLEAVRERVLSGGGVLFGPNRTRRGVIDDADVEVLEKILYGTGGSGGYTISRAEAELLFDLNDATVARDNASGWRDLFVKAVGNFLMFPKGDSTAMTADARRRHAAWLDSGDAAFTKEASKLIWREGVFGALKKARDMDRDDRDAAAAAAQTAEDEAARREAVDADEAAWLIDRIGRDGELHQNERALLVHIRTRATEIDPALEAHFEEAGV